MTSALAPLGIIPALLLMAYLDRLDAKGPAIVLDDAAAARALVASAPPQPPRVTAA